MKVSTTPSQPEKLIIGKSIETKNIVLKFAGFSTGDSLIQFEYVNKETNQTELVYVSLKYWDSYIRHNAFTDNSQNSGDYIFRPMTGQYEPYVYSNYSMNATIVKGEVDERMTFYFNTFQTPADGNDRQVIVHVSLDRDLDVIKVDVDWNSLPPIIYQGYEVIVDFAIDNFQNNQTFWTDSNGLEMQKRILNYRPTWNLSSYNYNDSLENVTANYYPINSAIQLKDVNSDRVFTVMNDRPQAGSALREGAVQLMQNRRIPADDSRGMGEWVDE